MNTLDANITHALDLALNREYSAMYLYESFENKFIVLGLSGFGKLFSQSAAEERDHIKTFTAYMLERSYIPKMLPIDIPSGQDEMSVLSCLKLALDTELNILESTKQLINECNDKHLESFLTDYILSGQYKCITELSRHINILSTISDDALSVWLYNTSL
uniref:Ferritin-like diiron domain-containing protein n=1 Tax=Rhinella marina erythrocytic-like virus TaxID=2859906 RepID=A0A8F6UAB8_9VIRU|nr:hypothetical protein with ferritin-like domain [Rhinella marina erythrocytic-like virus]